MRDKPNANPDRDRVQVAGDDVLDELLTALAAVTPEQIQLLTALGVPLAMTVMCGTARIEPDGEFYQPDVDGLEAVLLPVIDAGETIDLLAFNLANPARWWTRTGAHWALGADALDRLWLGDRLRVFRTPLSWLHAGAPYNGLVVLDLKAARLHVPHVEIIAEDMAHGVELDRLFAIPAQRPRIFVPELAA